MLIPVERLIRVNAAEAMSGDNPDPPPPFHDRARARSLDLSRERGGVRADLLSLPGRLAGHRPRARAGGERLRRGAPDAGGRGARGVGRIR
jgi:hypothetical protein